MRLPSSSGTEEGEEAAAAGGGSCVAEASQDSLDYYDASGTLGRGGRPAPRLGALLTERRRHASSGAVTAVENGGARTAGTENGGQRLHCKSDYTSSPCVYSDGVPAAARHGSYSTTAAGGQGEVSSSPGLQSRYSTPYHSAVLGEAGAAASADEEDNMNGGHNSAAVDTSSGAVANGLAYRRASLLNGYSRNPELSETNEEGRDVRFPSEEKNVRFSNGGYVGVDTSTCSSNSKSGTHNNDTAASPRVNTNGIKSSSSSRFSKVKNSPNSKSGQSGRKTTSGFVNYVPCVDVERDSTFSSPEEPTDAPRRPGNYTEFTLDRTGAIGTAPRPSNLAKQSFVSVSEDHLCNAESPSRSVGSGRSHRCKSSSSLSLNKAWKRNYVAFTDMDEEVSGREGEALTPEGFIPPSCSQQPLLCSPALEECGMPVEDEKITMYTFDKAGGGSTWNWPEEWSLSSLRLNHASPHLMVTAQWQQHDRMSCLYLGYRLFWALYFCLWAGWSLAGSMGYEAPWRLKVYYFTYLTNWSIWLLAVDAVLQAGNVVWHMRRMADQADVHYPCTPLRFRVSWLLSNTTFTVHMFITIAYWATVYPLRDDQAVSLIGVNTHLLPAVYVLLDAFISATPRRLLHALHPLLYFLLYVTFNITYYMLGGTDYQGRVALYPFMDWSSPGRTVSVIFGVLLLLTALHVLLCGLYALRVRLWHRYRAERYFREDCESERATKFDEQIV